MNPDSPFYSIWLEDSASLFTLSQASHAFSMIARSLRKSNDSMRFWFPDFFCNDALKPLREIAPRLGIEIIFYPISFNMRPDWSGCSRLQTIAPPDFFVLVHYFGQLNDLDQARIFCDQHRAKLIEDATHVLGPAGSIGRGGDFVCYSPRKFFDIPDGGILVARNGNDAALIADTWDLPSRRGPSTVRWRLKRWERIFRRQILRRQGDSKPLPRMTFKTELVSAEPFREIAISAYSRKQLAASLQPRRLIFLADRRKAFESLIANHVTNMDGVDVIDRGDNVIPSWVGLTCRSETTAQDALDSLRSSHFVTAPWPDRLPPEIISTPDYERAVQLRNRTLLVKPTKNYQGWI